MSKSINKTQNTEEETMPASLLEEMVATVKQSAEVAAKTAVEKVLSEQTENKTEDEAVESTKSQDVDKNVATEKESNPEIIQLTAAVKELTETVKNQAAEINSMKQDKTVAKRRKALAEAGLAGTFLQKALEQSWEMNESNFKSFCDLFVEMFNEKNFRSNSSDSQEDDKDVSEKIEGNQNDKENENTDNVSENSDTSEDETLIDMSDVEDSDPDVGGSQSNSAETLEDKMEQTVAKLMSARNKHWRRAYQNLEDN